jgi:hypothetical protein
MCDMAWIQLAEACAGMVPMRNEEFINTGLLYEG